MAYERNLVLVHTVKRQDRSDFESIRDILAGKAPDIEVFIVENSSRQSVTRRHAASRPALVFSPMPLKAFRPLRGQVYTGRPYTKIEEIHRLAAAGVRVPKSTLVEPTIRLDPAEWGPFTVLKPNVGMRGKSVQLRRTRDVRWVDPTTWPRDDARHGVPLVAQRFIDTGPHTRHYRVMAVFGRPVYSTSSTWKEPRPFVLDPHGSDPVDIPIAAQAQERILVLNFEEDVIAYGAKAARAFPEVPSVGVDVIREEATGDLYVMEVNAAGATWHISSDFGREVERKYGVDLAGQFGALDIIADALIDMTRRKAA